MNIAFLCHLWIKGTKRMYGISKRLDDKQSSLGIGWWFNDNSSKTIDLDGIILHSVCEPMQIEGA